MADPIDPQYREMMNRLARALDEGLGGLGFCLLVFPRNTPDGRVNYVSNANREDMIVALKEFIARQEGRVPPGAGHG
jgi:hypothetical protein